MEQTQGLTLEAFAEQVRQECVTIVSRCAFGHTKEAMILAGQLGERATAIVHGAAMERELEAGADLASLERYRNQPGIPE